MPDKIKKLFAEMEVSLVAIKQGEKPGEINNPNSNVAILQDLRKRPQRH